VFSNNRDGTFATPTEYEISGYNIKLIQVEDIDNDSFIDIIIGSYDEVIPVNSAGSISILKNQGDGTFILKERYRLNPIHSSLDFADIDNDGCLDMLCCNYKTNQLFIYLNKKDGTFAEPSRYDTGIFPRGITTTDINNDGWLDMLVSNMEGNEISVFINKGDGRFNSQVTYNTDAGPHNVTLSDIDNDGWIDMIVSNDKSLNYIFIFKNNQNGTFTKFDKYGLGNTYRQAIAKDVDNDGLEDIIQIEAGSYSWLDSEKKKDLFLFSEISVIANSTTADFDLHWNLPGFQPEKREMS